MKQVRAFTLSPAFIFLCVGLSFFLGLGWVPLFDLDEGAFTEATREMLESGIYSATYLDGEPRYDKPILFYWIQATTVTLFGFNEWAFRLPSVLMASLWAWAFYQFATQFIGRSRGTIATLFLVNCLWVCLIARSAIADATLNLFLSLAFFDIWRYFKEQKNAYLYRVYLWMGLGMLAKGPIAVAVPLAVSVLYLVFSKEKAALYKAYFNIVGWLIFIATVAPWVVAVYLEQGLGFFHGFIVEHNLKRFSSTRENHGGSLLYYFFALPLILLPLSGLLPKVALKARSLWQDNLNRFLLIWFAVIFTLFSFSKTQLPHYILNGCVPLFILIARQSTLFSRWRWSVIAPILAMTLFTALPWLIPESPADSTKFDVATLSRFDEVMFSAYYYFAFAGLFIVIALAVLPRLATWQRLVLSGVVINVFVFTVLVRLISGLQQQPIHNMIEFIENQPSQPTVVAFRMHMPSFSVYREKITPLRPPEAGEWVMTRVDRVSGLHERMQEADLTLTKLYQSGGLVLFSAEKNHEFKLGNLNQTIYSNNPSLVSCILFLGLDKA